MFCYVCWVWLLGWLGVGGVVSLVVCFGLLFVFDVLIVFGYWCFGIRGLCLCVGVNCVGGWSFAFGVALGFVVVVSACCVLFACLCKIVGLLLLGYYVWWIRGCFGVCLVVCCLC